MKFLLCRMKQQLFNLSILIKIKRFYILKNKMNFAFFLYDMQQSELAELASG